MSVLRVSCPHCDTPLDVPAHYAGRAGRCSSCRRQFTVPVAAPARRGRLWLGLGAVALFAGTGIALALAIALLRGPQARSPYPVQGQTPAPTVGGARRALLIGVNEYGRDSDLNDLQFPVRDVEDLGSVLRKHGYEVTLLATGGTAPTRDAIHKAFAAVKAKWAEGDTLVVAFAGHGTQPADTFYFCPADARRDDTNSLISINDVFAEMQACPGGVKLLLADACRDKPPPALSRSRIAEAVVSKTQPRKQLPPVPTNVTAFYSCSEGEQAFEHPTLGHGVFFHFVIKGLDGEADLNRNGEVTVPKLQDYVQKEVVSFVERQIGRRQQPAIDTKSNVYAPIVGRAGLAPPPPTSPPASKGFDYEEMFHAVAEGALPRGWEGREFAVTRARDGTPYLKLKRSAGRHYVHALRGVDLGQAFVLECEFALGPAQALEVAFASEGTPGVALVVRGDGTMLFPGARPARPEAFIRGGLNAIRLWRFGNKFRVAVNDDDDGADCAFDAELPRRLTGVSLGYVAAGADEIAIMNAIPANGLAGGPGPMGGAAAPSSRRRRDRSAAPADPGIYSLRVGKLPDKPTSAAPPTVRAVKVRHEFSDGADLPPGWEAKDFSVIRDEGGRKALLVKSNKSQEFTATLTAEGMGQGLNGDYFMEFEFAAGHDGLRIELDAIGTDLKVPAGTGDEAGRVQRLFVQRIGSTLTIVHDGKDADKHVHPRHGPQLPVREVRVTMKGGRDIRTAARLYAVRGGELEPRPGPPESAAPAAPHPRGLVLDFANGEQNRSDDWKVLRYDPKMPAVIEKGGRRWLGLQDRGVAVVALPRVDVSGDFTAEFDFTIDPGGIFGVRLTRIDRDPAKDRYFGVRFDGASNYADIDSVPKITPPPVLKALNYNGTNTLRLTRTGATITVDVNGKGHRAVTDYPREPFTAVQLMLVETTVPPAPPATPVGVTRVSVTPK